MDALTENKLAQVDELIAKLGLSRDEVIINLILSQDNVKNSMSTVKPYVMNYVMLEVALEGTSHCGATVNDYCRSEAFICKLEAEYSISIPSSVSDNWKTLEDVVETVCKLWTIKNYCTHLCILN